MKLSLLFSQPITNLVWNRCRSAQYMRQQEFWSYDGQLLWKISEFARRRNKAVSGEQISFYSPCFYTSRYGYKMRNRIYLNGNGMDRGTRISVFCCHARSVWCNLRWPFRKKSHSCCWIKITWNTWSMLSGLMLTAPHFRDLGGKQTLPRWYHVP